MVKANDSRKSKTLLNRVLGRIKPSKNEKARELAFAVELVKKINAIEGKHAEVMLAGSLARGTNLKGDRDIDIFVLFPEKMPEKEFEKEGLRIGKTAFKGHKWEEAFSQHPYIRGEINGFDVEVVPSYKVESASMLKSAVDRSPFHSAYLEKKLSEKQKEEVLLLKQFLKGIRAYGAELKTSSVPGYVTELLILAYGDFLGCMKGVSGWHEGKIIDLEKHLAPEEARKKFHHSPLIVVDPVDENRNVAAALSEQQFARLVAAANAFLKKPSKIFFFPKKTKPMAIAKLKKKLVEKNFLGLFLLFPKGLLPDIFWGQLKRIERKASNQLREGDFTVLRHVAWTDEKKDTAIIFELESLEIEQTEQRIGPMVSQKEHSAAFLAAHKKPLSGPRVENGRWVLEEKRSHWHAEKLLKDALEKLKKTEKGMRKAFSKAKALDEKAISVLYRKNKLFAEFLTEFIEGKEIWE
ncbi:MAG: CCA tRNA nucleotidyltransferase [Candidatus Diapherotrites archaeon]